METSKKFTKKKARSLPVSKALIEYILRYFWDSVEEQIYSRNKVRESTQCIASWNMKSGFYNYFFESLTLFPKNNFYWFFTHFIKKKKQWNDGLGNVWMIEDTEWLQFLFFLFKLFISNDIHKKRRGFTLNECFAVI